MSETFHFRKDAQTWARHTESLKPAIFPQM